MINKTKTVERQPGICPEMFAIVFTSHQKTRVLRGFPRKQKLNGKKTAYFVQYMVSTRQKKERKKKRRKKEKEFVDLHDERIKYFGHFNV